MALSKIDSDGIVSGGITADSLNIGQIGGRRNLIINGAMQVAQRGTSAITGNGYAVDRFYGSKFATDQLAHSIQQVSDAPDDFSYSLKYTVTTAETTMEATENVPFYQNIEGFNTAHLNLGTANAKTFTLSFYVKSSLTGTFGGSFQNSATDRSYPFTYTISSANTWERKTVTVTGDTSGTWVGATNGVGLRLYFSMGAGATRLGTAGAWASDNYTGATGQTQITENLNATWQITGVQLEVGTVATPFEHRSYGEELALCQRYYEKSYSQGTAPGTATDTGRVLSMFGNTTSGFVGGYITFTSTKRSNPTVTMFAPSDGSSGNAAYYVFGSSTTTTTLNASQVCDRGTAYYASGTNCDGIALHYTADAEL